MSIISDEIAPRAVVTQGSSEAASSSLIVSIDPATGAENDRVTPATHHQVAVAVAAARAALPGWRGTSPAARGAALRAAAADLRADLDRLALLHTRDTGRLLADSRSAVEVAASLLEEAATLAPLDAGRSLGGDPRALDVVRREPRGVVAVITPWNDPLPAAAGLLAAAPATGNTVVPKPSERSPLVGAALAETLARHLPDGVLELVQGDGAVGERLVADPRVDVVAHVGSSRAGRRIAEVAGSRAAKLLLENGGKDALVVDSGVDPAWAAQQAALGAFVNAGQLCVAVERVVVHAEVADAFLAALVEEAAAWTVGDPTDAGTRLGPLVDGRAVEGVLEHVSAAVAGGARVLTGGGRPADPGLAAGSYLEPTVLAGVTPDMAGWSGGTFGPVVPLIVAGAFDEALQLAPAGAHRPPPPPPPPAVQHPPRALP